MDSLYLANPSGLLSPSESSGPYAVHRLDASSLSEIVEEVTTDGGATIDGLSGELGKYLATIYQVIENFHDDLELDQGDVSFQVRKYHDELHALVESAEYAIKNYADRIPHVMGLADHVAELSPFQQWITENGADIDFDQEGDPERLRINTILSNLKSSSFENVHTTAAEELEKGSKSGNDLSVLRRA
ncbi:hypothetical protein C492_02612 [Natronococcus jeotgali DSM 18795]|uniref:Uncharacterized protein n=1 Tax=Natronococcus jeotgali DSM 18795 TaxID=1227498 RepID=L9XWN7_9EURY|nr:hypothetical protein [Natronococcus jeotgali]ELY65846.1 hypothetical protein C492_02612 [Natronococcus jeotgali DSM 18795]